MSKWMTLLGGRLSRAALLLAVFALASCASVVPRDHLVGKEELTRVILKQFPLQKDQGIFHLALNAPQVTLRPEQNRVGFACDYEVKSILGGVLRGRFDSSSDLRYDPIRRAVVLVKPQIEHLEVQGQGELPEPMKGLVNLAMAELMKDYPLHSFPPGEPSFAGVELDITAINVTQDGVLLHLAPKSKVSPAPVSDAR